MIDIRNAMNDIYKNLEPILTKCGFKNHHSPDISDGIPVGHERARRHGFFRRKQGAAH